LQDAPTGYSQREIHVIQLKTGVELYLPIVPELELAMKACPVKGMTLIGDQNARSFRIYASCDCGCGPARTMQFPRAAQGAYAPIG
jgi:hypothetical protein